MSDSVEQLHRHLIDVGVDDELPRLLADAWSLLEGSSEEAMAAWKLSRLENPVWDSPVLSFEIERHGGTVKRSTRAEIQHWCVDLSRRTADCSSAGFRQVSRARQRLDVDPIAESLAAAISAGAADPLLEWSADTSSVRVLMTQAVNPDGAPRETLARRRKRLSKALAAKLETIGWHATGQPGRYRRPDR